MDLPLSGVFVSRFPVTHTLKMFYKTTHNNPLNIWGNISNY